MSGTERREVPNVNNLTAADLQQFTTSVLQGGLLDTDLIAFLQNADTNCRNDHKMFIFILYESIRITLNIESQGIFNKRYGYVHEFYEQSWLFCNNPNYQIGNLANVIPKLTQAFNLMLINSKIRITLDSSVVYFCVSSTMLEISIKEIEKDITEVNCESAELESHVDYLFKFYLTWISNKISGEYLKDYFEIIQDKNIDLIVRMLKVFSSILVSKYGINKYKEYIDFFESQDRKRENLLKYSKKPIMGDAILIHWYPYGADQTGHVGLLILPDGLKVEPSSCLDFLASPAVENAMYRGLVPIFDDSTEKKQDVKLVLKNAQEGSVKGRFVTTFEEDMKLHFINEKDFSKDELKKKLNERIEAVLIKDLNVAYMRAVYEFKYEFLLMIDALNWTLPGRGYKERHHNCCTFVLSMIFEGKIGYLDLYDQLPFRETEWNKLIDYMNYPGGHSMLYEVLWYFLPALIECWRPDKLICKMFELAEKNRVTTTPKNTTELVKVLSMSEPDTSQPRPPTELELFENSWRGRLFPNQKAKTPGLNWLIKSHKALFSEFPHLKEELETNAAKDHN